jgi:hypothetical protein
MRNQRTFKTNSIKSGRLRVKPDAAKRVGADLRVCPAGDDGGAMAEMQVNGLSRETILRLIDWIKQV